jgi:hypothetical protein
MGLTLPNEVLLMVGEQLDKHQDRWNLVFVCRDFHNVFLSLVYGKVALRNWRDMKSFLYVVVKQVTLAKSVRELDLSGWQMEAFSDEELNIIENDIDLENLVKASSDSIEEAKRWQQSLGKGLCDAWIALALPLLTHLRYLQMKFNEKPHFMDLTMQRAVNGEKPFHDQTAFRYLQKVVCDRVDHADPQDPFDHLHPNSAALLMSFFYFPSMRAIDANMVIDPSTAIGELSNKPGFSSVSEINLRSSCGNRGMQVLIESCAGLVSFKYQHSDAHVHSHGYQPTAFYRSLTRSRETLQTLWLDNYGSHYSFTAAGLNQNHDEWFGPLSDFTALRELRIRLSNLLDIQYQSDPTKPLVDCLPRSIETLYIEDCNERYLVMLVSQLQLVLKHRLTRLPKLQRVYIEGPFRNDRSDYSGNDSTTVMNTVDHSIKSKVIQAVEPLHESCLAARVELYVHDRAFTRNAHG